MESSNAKRIWQAPWGYPESFAVVGGIALVGLLLQYIVGSFDFYLLVAPINLYVFGAILSASIILGSLARKSAFVRWLSGVGISVAIISLMTLLTIIMGVTPQMSEQTTRLGFEMMTACWPFVLLYLLLLLSLGSLIVSRCLRFRVADISFVLNHLGVWILLAASALGYADMQRYIMYVNEGETEWRVYDAEKNIKELPIAITLNDFSAEYYPARKVVVDTETGEIQRGEPDDFDIGDFEIGERYRVMATAPEPRRFSSEVEVNTEYGDSRKATIEVNNPLRVGSWMIYQYGYDNAAGNNSTYSSFELVYDRWLLPVYIGIIMMMLGAVTMLWSGRKRRGGQDGLE